MLPLLDEHDPHTIVRRVEVNDDLLFPQRGPSKPRDWRIENWPGVCDWIGIELEQQLREALLFGPGPLRVAEVVASRIGHLHIAVEEPPLATSGRTAQPSDKVHQR